MKNWLHWAMHFTNRMPNTTDCSLVQGKDLRIWSFKALAHIYCSSPHLQWACTHVPHILCKWYLLKENQGIKEGKRKSILVSPALVMGVQSKNAAKLQPKQQASSSLIFYLAPSSDCFSMDPSSLSTLEPKPGEQVVNRIKLFSLCGRKYTQILPPPPTHTQPPDKTW